ncbi:MAG: tetratricopeptide repeat protein, partial [Candidatus Kapabacteria bacterium]|nr:tetratricopeptide repeat protein [Candidatus Kapabacteria bacterium]
EALGDERGTSATLHQMANVLVTRGDLDGAMRLYQQSLQLQEALGDVRGQSAALHAIADVLARRGDLDGAMRLYEQELIITKEVLGHRHPQTQQILSRLGLLLSEQGEFVTARQYLEQSLEICEQVFGANHPATAESLKNLGHVLSAQCNYTEARSYYERALAIFERSYGPTHIETIAALRDAAGASLMEENYADARPLYQRLLSASEQMGDAALSATALIGLAKTHLYLRDHDQAIDAAQRALAIRESLDETASPSIGEIVEVLGLARQDKGDFATALPLLEQAFNRVQRSLPEDSVEAIQTLNNFAMIRWEMQDVQSREQLVLLTERLSAKIRHYEPDNDDIPTIVESITAELGAVVTSASEQNKGAMLNRITERFDALSVQIERSPRIRRLLGSILRRWRTVVSRVAGRVGRLPMLTFIPSPYIFTVPVQGRQLVGRDDIFRRIETIWSRPGQRNSILIHGHRRMGKTSIAQALQSRCNFGD